MWITMITEIRDNQVKNNPRGFPGKRGKIKSLCELKNSFKYNLRNVLILNYGDYYRLIVINDNVLLMDESYKTAKGAKIAFMKKFSQRKFKHLKNRVCPKWSTFSPIDTNIDITKIYIRIAKE